MQLSPKQQEQLWKGLSTVAAIGAGVAVRKLITAIWTRTMQEEPPKNPAASDVPWRQALAWSAAVGAAVGVGRLIGRRGATELWERQMGFLPPNQG